MDHVQQMSGGDVAHVERRILPQPDHIDLGKIQVLHRTKCHVVAGNPLQGCRLRLRHHTPFAVAKLVGRVDEHLMPARLRFQCNAETAVTVDIDGFDRVHLKGNA